MKLQLLLKAEPMKSNNTKQNRVNFSKISASFYRVLGRNCLVYQLAGTPRCVKKIRKVFCLLHTTICSKPNASQGKKMAKIDQFFLNRCDHLLGGKALQ